ncbi:hypothetical protein OKA04_05145 [Luteolibacter flavescens]|uniref:Uncharacterized protein n=1 Tax=Luteolibacter flavescens TaxID=1859460 RepID=A0ABT3FKM2_9BACT|nr:hypothetical protein [Luteolibacter flavescens]MCW1884105.1 hypothetical protein [Luteolibacter flavescens]
MTRTQIQLPDELYRRAKRFSAEREVSLAEMTRRGLELLLERYPDENSKSTEWTLPQVKGGGIKVPLAQLHEAAAEDQARRGKRR